MGYRLSQLYNICLWLYSVTWNDVVIVALLDNLKWPGIKCYINKLKSIGSRTGKLSKVNLLIERSRILWFAWGKANIVCVWNNEPNEYVNEISIEIVCPYQHRSRVWVRGFVFVCFRLKWWHNSYWNRIQMIRFMSSRMIKLLGSGNKAIGVAIELCNLDRSVV